MNGKTTITIREKEYNLWFNNFAIKEMYSKLFDSQYANPDMEALLKAINELNDRNYLLIVKLFLFSGIVGAELAEGKYKPTVTDQEIGELVASMSDEDVGQFFGKIWLCFWDSFGANLEKIVELEKEESTLEKKK